MPHAAALELKHESAQISQSNHKLLCQGNIFQSPDAQALNSLGLSICEVLPLKNISYFPSAKYTLLSNSLKPHSYICLTCVHSAHNCNYIYVLLLDMCHVFFNFSVLLLLWTLTISQAKNRKELPCHSMDTVL